MDDGYKNINRLTINELTFNGDVELVDCKHIPIPLVIYSYVQTFNNKVLIY